MYKACVKLLCVVLAELDFSSLKWGDSEVSLLCPPEGAEPFIAISELVDKVSHGNLLYVYIHVPVHIHCTQCTFYVPLMYMYMYILCT